MADKVKREDVVKYLELLRVVYGEKAFPTPTDSGYELLLSVWYKVLQVYEVDIVNLAIEQVLRKSEFAPKIATVTKTIEDLKEVYEGKDDNELWEELENVLYDVADNASRYHFDYSGEVAMQRNRDIYESLSPEIKGFVRNCGQLVQIAMSDETAISIVRGRFIKALPDIRRRQKIKKEVQRELLFISGKTLKQLN